MGLKKGTKLTDNPRDINLKIRLTKDESKLLEKCAEQMKCTKTDVVIKGLLLVKESIKNKR